MADHEHHLYKERFDAEEPAAQIRSHEDRSWRNVRVDPRNLVEVRVSMHSEDNG
jgi:hypothetical protein